MSKSSSRVKATAGGTSLVLQTRHRLRVGSTEIIGRLSDKIDVILAASGTLSIAFRGILHEKPISAAVLLSSQLAQHLVEYFHANAEELGIAAVSKLYLGDDGMPKLTLTSSRCSFPRHQMCASLTALELCYVWQIQSANSENLLSSPFGPQLSLPFRSLLDNAVGRFVTHHVVKRYPLIFGRWCQQLDLEATFFPRIYTAITSIIARSPNRDFRVQCRRLLKSMAKKHRAESQAEMSILADYLESSKDIPESTAEDVFNRSMELLYRSGLRRAGYKGTTHISPTNGTEDNDLANVSHPSSPLLAGLAGDEPLVWRGTNSGPHPGLDLASEAFIMEPYDHMPSDDGPSARDVYTKYHADRFGLDSSSDWEIETQFLSQDIVSDNDSGSGLTCISQNVDIQDDDLFEDNSALDEMIPHFQGPVTWSPGPLAIDQVMLDQDDTDDCILNESQQLAHGMNFSSDEDCRPYYDLGRRDAFVPQPPTFPSTDTGLIYSEDEGVSILYLKDMVHSQIEPPRFLYNNSLDDDDMPDLTADYSDSTSSPNSTPTDTNSSQCITTMPMIFDSNHSDTDDIDVMFAKTTKTLSDMHHATSEVSDPSASETEDFCMDPDDEFEEPSGVPVHPQTSEDLIDVLEMDDDLFDDTHRSQSFAHNPHNGSNFQCSHEAGISNNIALVGHSHLGDYNGVDILLIEDDDMLF